MTTAVFTVGAALRPAFRRLCFILDLRVDEQKGFLESAFRVSGDEKGLRVIYDRIEAINRQEAEERAARVLREIQERQRRDARWYRRLWRALFR